MNKRQLTSKMKKLGNFIKENLNTIEPNKYGDLESEVIENYTDEIFPDVMEFTSDNHSMWFITEANYEGTVNKKDVLDSFSNSDEKRYFKSVVAVDGVIQIVIELNETSIIITANVDISYKDIYGNIETTCVDIKEIEIPLN